MVPLSGRSSTGYTASILASNAHLRLLASSHLHTHKHIRRTSNLLRGDIFLMGMCTRLCLFLRLDTTSRFISLYL